MEGALAEIVSALAGGSAADSRIDGALASVTDILAGRCGLGSAIYVRETASPELGLRAHRPAPGHTASPVDTLRADLHVEILERVHAGMGAVGGAGDDRGAALLTRAGQPGGLLVPVRMDDETIGALIIAGPEGRHIAAAEERLAHDAATALALALGNARLFTGLRERSQALDRQIRQLDALAEVARRVAVAVDEGDVAATVAREARRLVRADMAVLFIRDPSGALRPGGADGWRHGDPLPAVAELGAGEGPGPVWMGRELAVAVAGGDGADTRPPGLLVVARTSGAPFGDDDLGRLTGLAHQAAVALENARLVSRLRREQGERQTLASEIVRAQEEERQRVAEDIHDGPVQELVGVSLLLDALATDLRTAAPPMVDQVSRAAASARDAVRALRRAIFDLHPMSLQELGFTAATRTLVQRLEWQGVRVELDVGAADALSAPLRTVAFRTCQEAIANVLRHAEPNTVSVRAVQVDTDVVLEVVDDGRGFDPDQPTEGIGKGHLGLRAMRERVSLVDGDLQVISAEGGGTTVRLTLPVQAA